MIILEKCIDGHIIIDINIIINSIPCFRDSFSLIIQRTKTQSTVQFNERIIQIFSISTSNI